MILGLFIFAVIGAATGGLVGLILGILAWWVFVAMFFPNHE